MNRLSLLLLAFFGLHPNASAHVSCAIQLQSKPFHKLIYAVAKKDPAKITKARVRVSGGDSARGDYDHMSRALVEQGYKVGFKFLGVSQNKIGTHVDFEIWGTGRDVAQALFEISNPDVGRSLSPNPPQWIQEVSVLPEFSLIVDSETEDFEKLSKRPINRMGFSVRTWNVLRTQGIVFLGELIAFDEKKLMDLPGMGEVSQKEIALKLAELGLKLGMKPPKKPHKEMSKLELQMAKSENIEFSDWISHSKKKPLTLFESDNFGLSLRRPRVYVTQRDGEGVFALHYAEAFLQADPKDIGERLSWMNWSVKKSFDKTELVNEIKNLQKNFSSLPKYSVTEIFGDNAERYLDVLRQEGRAFILTPPAGSPLEGNGGILVLPFEI